MCLIWLSYRHKLSDCAWFRIFVGSMQWTFFFWLSSEDDRHGRDHTYCIKTNMCYFLWESIKHMLSIFFAIELCYKIKENNNIEKIILPRPVTILPMSIAILQAKIEKSLFCISIFLPRPKNLHW